MKLNFVLLVIMVCLLESCKKETVVGDIEASIITAESTAFSNNGTLPAKYTCDGLGISPPITWKTAPAGTKSFAVVMHHIPPTGDTHVYMLVYNIGSSIGSLAEKTANVGIFGANTVNGKTEYTPPCSQGPGAKAYIMTVYALSAEPVFPSSATKITRDVLLAAISKTTIGMAIINVNYTRQ
jgi:phosphatidylethanolamine-binding protein (PEBP) family uncharacterized protein